MDALLLITDFTIVLVPYTNLWHPGAEIIQAWRVSISEPLANGNIRVSLDTHVEEPDADPLVILWYQKGLLPSADGCHLMLWRDELWSYRQRLVKLSPR